MDASVAHQRRIRLLFTELEAAEGSQKSQQSEKDEDISPIVQVRYGLHKGTVLVTVMLRCIYREGTMVGPKPF